MLRSGIDIDAAVASVTVHHLVLGVVGCDGHERGTRNDRKHGYE